MATARSASAAPRTQRQARVAPAPRKLALRRTAVRVRWERVGRVSLLLVLAVVIGLYAQHLMSLISTHATAERELTTVRRLVHDNGVLARQQQSLGQSATIERDARALGMVQPGERSYVITGLK